MMQHLLYTASRLMHSSLSNYNKPSIYQRCCKNEIGMYKRAVRRALERYANMPGVSTLNDLFILVYILYSVI